MQIDNIDSQLEWVAHLRGIENKYFFKELEHLQN